MKVTNMKAMIFAAGLGSRLKPFTEKSPKALFPVNGIPLLQRNIEYLKSYGFEDFVINVHHFADQIITFLKENDNFGVNIKVSDESYQLLETGGALIKAKDLLGSKPFLAMNADILTDLPLNDFIDFHKREKPLISLAVSNRNSSRKLLFDNSQKLCGWKNIKNNEIISTGSYPIHELAFSGLHIIEPSFFEFNTFQGKFSIIKSYLDLMTTHSIKGYDHTGSKLIDVGKPENINSAENLFK